jgi:TetR/AcrR family acrAB operon transcriptional repressor
MMRRTKEEAAETRESLLKAALTVFDRKGYASTTLQDVAKEAVVTRGAIYWHFGGKAELYNAFMDEYSAQAGQIVQVAVAEGGSLVDVLRRIFVRLLAAVESDPALRAVMEISLFNTERTAELMEPQQQQLESGRALLAGIAEAMRQGIDSAELCQDIDPAEMGRAFIACQNGLIHMWLLDPKTFSLKESAPALAEIFLQGILPRRCSGQG